MSPHGPHHDIFIHPDGPLTCATCPSDACEVINALKAAHAALNGTEHTDVFFQVADVLYPPGLDFGGDDPTDVVPIEETP